MFSQGDSALHTSRVYKIRNDTLILGIIGGVAGVFELVAIFMKPIEEKYEAWVKRFSKATKKKYGDTKWYLVPYFKDDEDIVPETGDATVLPSPWNGDAE